MIALSLWKLWPFKLELQGNACLAFIIQILQLKQIFSKIASRVLIGTLSKRTRSRRRGQEDPVKRTRSRGRGQEDAVKRTQSRRRGGQQEDLHSNWITDERISIAWPPRLFDRYLLLKVPNISYLLHQHRKLLGINLILTMLFNV